MIIFLIDTKRNNTITANIWNKITISLENNFKGTLQKNK